MSFDFTIIIISLVSMLGLIVFASGILLIFKSIFGFRAQVNRAVNMDLEIVRVSKIFKKKEEAAQSTKEQWQEEIGAMEQLLTTLSGIREKKSPLASFLYGQPNLVLEIANPAGSEEIFFYIAIPKKFRESAEKQIHAYFPNASLEKVSDYTIFSPGGFTAAAALSLKNKYALPVRTYLAMNVDPLNEISNALSKLKTGKEGAAIQLILQPAGTQWRKLGRSC